MRYTKGWSGLCLVLCGALVLSCSSTKSRTNPPEADPLPRVSEPAPPVIPPVAPKAQFDPQVRQIQGALQERGYNPGPLDGVLGKKTKAALRRFQRDHRLAVTGDINPETKNALLTPPQPAESEAIDEGETY